ncbi:DUF3576 domain-containing protein [Candidatus Pelagibacter bacterium]|jgi:hypothetical protein|nr:DUF3576 domain-containing protein [Candidatus Pelagibacter bacterium]
MKMIFKYKITIILLVFSIFVLNSCASLPGGDARNNPPNPKKRVAKNLAEGKGFRLDTAIDKGFKGGGSYEFASSNELWRASLDVLDFMPLVSANYSGGIIITDWYSDNNNDSIKITLRFLTNEIRSDALKIKIFYKKCLSDQNCKVSERSGELEKELKKQILKRAATYEKQIKDKNFKKYDPGSKTEAKDKN